MAQKFSRTQLDKSLAAGAIDQATYDVMINSGLVTAGRGGATKDKYFITDANDVRVEVGIRYSGSGVKGFKVSSTAEVTALKDALEAVLVEHCEVESVA